jgi:hypothetical protein
MSNIFIIKEMVVVPSVTVLIARAIRRGIKSKKE